MVPHGAPTASDWSTALHRRPVTASTLLPRSQRALLLPPRPCHHTSHLATVMQPQRLSHRLASRKTVISGRQ